MNTLITSREEILKAAKALSLSQEESALGMRAVAKECGIAVGTIYHYFPTKEDLTVAIVAEVWGEIFYPALCFEKSTGFLSMVEQMLTCIHEGIQKYPGFFARHINAISDKSKGRAAMTAYFKRIEEGLHQALESDTSIRRDRWSEAFTPEAFVAFTLDFLRTDLMLGRERGAFLIALIKRAIYQ